MAGVYVHIPFCRQACHYCDFHFSTQVKGVGDMVNSIVQEARMRIRQDPSWKSQTYRTLYLGGGTPSLLGTNQLRALIVGVQDALEFRVEELEEFTLEANPEDLTRGNIQAWRDMGIQRLSVGVQSFDDPTLVWMNRAHTGQQALDGLSLACELGITSISLDLIYGVPTNRNWAKDVETALSLPIQHLSAYSLTVEPQTALGTWVKKGVVREVADELVREEYDHLCGAMNRAGWSHYETSNWAAPKKGEGHHLAVHNRAYWGGHAYLGLGPGAHGFDGSVRYANVSNNPRYIQAIKGQELSCEEEHLGVRDRYNESIMTGLRTARGIHPGELKQAHGRSPAEDDNWKRWVDLGVIVPGADGWHRIPETHWLTGDQVSSSLFWVE